MNKSIILLLLLCGTLFATIGNGGSDDNDDENLGDLVASLSSSCDVNTVMVVDGHGDPVEDAEVDVFNEFNLNQILDDELTDADGKVTFEGCGIEVRIIATKNNYKTYSIIRNLVSCDQCGCQDDSECLATEECLDNACTPIDCCGVVIDHVCVPNECGSGPLCESCPEGKECVDSVCLDTCANESSCKFGEDCVSGICKPKPECESDDDCKDNEQCLEIADGLWACAEIGGCCGVVSNHSCIEFECGTGENCMSCAEGSFCIDHECREFDISPALVGDRIVVSVPDDCRNCTIEAIDPAGSPSGYPPDGSGVVRIPVHLSGTYVVGLLGSDGRLYVKKDVVVSIFEEPEKDFFLSTLESPWFWLLILVLIIAFVLIYRRFHGSERMKKK